MNVFQNNIMTDKTTTSHLNYFPTIPFSHETENNYIFSLSLLSISASFTKSYACISYHYLCLENENISLHIHTKIKRRQMRKWSKCIHLSDSSHFQTVFSQKALWKVYWYRTKGKLTTISDKDKRTFEEKSF